jgi:hypothetical protein
MAIPTETQRTRDIMLIVGGNFTEDALGPLYQEVLTRLRGAPSAYLDTFERLFVARPVNAQQLSKLYLPSFLQRLAGVAPDRVRALAGHLLGQIDATAREMEQVVAEIGALDPQPQEVTFAVENLQIRRREFQQLSAMARKR